MTTPYATVDDLATFLGTEPPPGCARLLVRATELVDWELVATIYDADNNGLATDPALVTAFRDGVCAQVEWWIQNGIVDEQGLGLAIQTMTLGPASVTFAPGAAIRASTLAPRTVQILSKAAVVPGIPL